MRPGQSFEQLEVFRNYRFRPDYPAELYDKLVALSPRTHSVLDLGCGPGKIANGLSSQFDTVTAVDASEPMLQLGIEQQADQGNIVWVHGLAESVDLDTGPFDLIVAAASIHWMDHAKLFPRLLDQVSDDHVFVVVDGDGAYNPPWERAWNQFMAKWISRLKDEVYEPDNNESAFSRRMTRHRDWIDLKGRLNLDYGVSQSIDDFIRCQHSRDTFAPSKLGSEIGAFDMELRSILEIHAVNDVVTYNVQTRLEWGSILPLA